MYIIIVNLLCLFLIVFLLLFAASSQSRTHTHQSCLFVCLFFFGGFLLYRFQKENVFPLREEKKQTSVPSIGIYIQLLSFLIFIQ